MSVSAQVLARPGWAGSGVAPESWWPRAVFYRIDPSRFQDSDGDGKGDLRGIVQRLDYLQSLGVDALVLDSGPEPWDENALEDLIREASQHQMRVLPTADAKLPLPELIRTTHDWLGLGAAGLWLPKPKAFDLSAYAGIVGSLRSLVGSFPGDRVLLTDPAPLPLSLQPQPIRSLRRAGPDSPSSAKAGLLVTSALFAVTSPEVGAMRSSLMNAAADPLAGESGLLRFASTPPTDSPDGPAEAAVLLGSRGAVLLDFGQEIGLDTYPSTPGAVPPMMQWTPSNRTPEATGEQADAQSRPLPAPEYGAYHPYVRPPRSLTGLPTVKVEVVPDRNIPAALPAPNTLPGFSAGTLPQPPQDGDRINVITEDRDPHSLLNIYRQLIALHHGNPTLRNGTESVLNRDAEQTLVWVRRAPANSKTAASIVGTANLSGQAVTLDLGADLDEKGMRGGALRPLLSVPADAAPGATTAHLALPAHGVFLGEIFHGGSLSGSASRAHSGGRRSRHHRKR